MYFFFLFTPVLVCHQVHINTSLSVLSVGVFLFFLSCKKNQWNAHLSLTLKLASTDPVLRYSKKASLYHISLQWPQQTAACYWGLAADWALLAPSEQKCLLLCQSSASSTCIFCSSVSECMWMSTNEVECILFIAFLPVSLIPPVAE